MPRDTSLDEDIIAEKENGVDSYHLLKNHHHAPDDKRAVQSGREKSSQCDGFLSV